MNMTIRNLGLALCLSLVAAISMAQSAPSLDLEKIQQLKVANRITGPLFSAGDQLLGLQQLPSQQVRFVRISLQDSTVTQVTEGFDQNEAHKIQSLMRSEIRNLNSSQLSAFFNLTKGAGNFLALGEGFVSFPRGTIAGFIIADLVTSPVQLLFWSYDKPRRYLRSLQTETALNLQSESLVIRLNAEQFELIDLAARMSVTSIVGRTCQSAVL